MKLKTFFYSFGLAFLLTASSYAMDSRLFDSGISVDEGDGPTHAASSQLRSSPRPQLPSMEVGLADMTEAEFHEAFRASTHHLAVSLSTDLPKNTRLSENPDSSKWNKTFLKLLRDHPSAPALVRKLDLSFPSEEVWEVLPSLEILHTLNLRNIDASTLQKILTTKELGRKSPSIFPGAALSEQGEHSSDSLFPSSLRNLTLSFNSSTPPLDFESWPLMKYEYFTITGGVTVDNLPDLLKRVQASKALTINGNFTTKDQGGLAEAFKDVSSSYLVRNGRKTIFPVYR